MHSNGILMLDARCVHPLRLRFFLIVVYKNTNVFSEAIYQSKPSFVEIFEIFISIFGIYFKCISVEFSLFLVIINI